MNSDDAIKRLTREIGEKLRHEAAEELASRALTQSLVETPHVWQLRLELSYNPSVTYDLTLEDDLTIGREPSEDTVAIFPTVDTADLGLSRRHVMLRPTASVLYLVDLGSTNGSRLNTRLLGANIPYPLMNGDMVTLGRLEFIVRILQMPKTLESVAPSTSQELETIMPMIIRGITTQLTIKDVIQQSLEMTRLYAAAEEVSVWLVDEMSGELFLEASYGMKDQKVFHLALETSLAGQAIKQGKPQRTNRRADGDPIKLKTGYIAEGVIYVPLTLGDMQVGVISAVHRDPGKVFTGADERTMVMIADLTAVAIQNARQYEVTRQELTRKSKVVSAFQYALSQEIKKRLHSVVGYATLLQSDDSLRDETLEMLGSISGAGETMIDLIERLISMARLSVEPIVQRCPCDLVEIVGNAVDAVMDEAESKAINLHAQVEGKPFKIRGDAQYLFHCVYNLLDNAVKFTPQRGEIGLRLIFAAEGIIIDVQDTGPGIPEDELLDLFNRYFHREPNTGAQGIGVGLEIVRTTVEAHMGTVTAHNLPEGGAEFVITLPMSIRTDWPQKTGEL